jgi:hypothetical protein
VRIVIEGRNLPGRHFAEHDNVHVALQVRSDPEGPVPGDASSARWETVVRRVDGDVRGPAVHGRRGERFLYLTWGDPHGDDWRMSPRPTSYAPLTRQKLSDGSTSSQASGARSL